jgi:uncharacterized protein YndB with AHSA1/START domain
MTKKNLAAKTDIAAPPDQVWRVVSDLNRMPEWSPQCRWIRLLGRLQAGAYTININRQGRKFWPTISKIERLEPGRVIAFRTVTNDSVWVFEVEATATGSVVTERRIVPAEGTKWVSRTIVEHLLGGEDSFDDEMLEGMNTTLRKIKAAVENSALPRSK